MAIYQTLGLFGKKGLRTIAEFQFVCKGWQQFNQSKKYKPFLSRTIPNVYTSGIVLNRTGIFIGGY